MNDDHVFEIAGDVQNYAEIADDNNFSMIAEDDDSDITRLRVIFRILLRS